MANVCFLFGINGVGKSTLARAITAALPGAVTVSGSHELRKALGGMTRERLERTDPQEKRRLLRDTLLEAFTAHVAAPLIVCDTHLVVPIRADGSVRYERMWDDDYRPFTRTLCNVTASVTVIMGRRQRDTRNGTRIRESSPDDIAQDDRTNREEFRQRFGAWRSAFEVTNSGLPDAAARVLLTAIG